jgi:hypothetical protein
MLILRFPVPKRYNKPPRESLSLPPSLKPPYRKDLFPKVPTAFASSSSSKDAESDPIVSTMTSGKNASASTSSKKKDGMSILQTSKSVRDEDITHTTKMIEKRGSERRRMRKQCQGIWVGRMIRREIAKKKSLVKRAACLLLLLPEARSLVRRVAQSFTPVVNWYQRCWMIRSG